ncbi:MAG: serine hydrolase domain-containing protein, partial [Actinomycetota bacterium]
MSAVEPLPDGLQAALRRRLREKQVYGIAVCGFDRDGIRFVGGVGHADLARGEPVEPTTVFRVASISKLLTATLVLRLVDDGELSLDGPVNDLLPEELAIKDGDDRPVDVSLRSMLSHSSGLPYGLRGTDAGNRVLSRLANQGRVRDLADAIRGLRLTHEPGTKIVYSNPAYNVLGHVAAERAGRSFEAASRSQVLQPLGMVDSAFGHRQGPGVATPYGSLFPPAVSDRPVDRMRLIATPMGGLTTTVLDLARFGRMVLNGGELDGRRFLDPATVAEATSTQARNHPALEQGYGLGFKTRRWRGRDLVGHDGNMP